MTKNTGELRGFGKQMEKEGRVHHSLRAWLHAAEQFPTTHVGKKGSSGMTLTVNKNGLYDVLTPSEWMGLRANKITNRYERWSNLTEKQKEGMSPERRAQQSGHHVRGPEGIQRNLSEMRNVGAKLKVLRECQEAYPFITHISSSRNDRATVTYYAAKHTGDSEGAWDPCTEWNGNDYKIGHYKHYNQRVIRGFSVKGVQNLRLWSKVTEGMGAVSNGQHIHNMTYQLKNAQKRVDEGKAGILKAEEKFADPEWVAKFLARTKKNEIENISMKWKEDSLKDQLKRLKDAETRKSMTEEGFIAEYLSEIVVEDYVDKRKAKA